MAGSSSTVTNPQGWSTPEAEGVMRIDIAYVADDGDGSIPDAITDSFSGFIVGCTHAPGSTAATTLMDVVAEDINGVDLLCGAGTDIVTTADMQRMPNPDGESFGLFPVVGSLTVKFTNNSVNDAFGVFSIFIAQ